MDLVPVRVQVYAKTQSPLAVVGKQEGFHSGVIQPFTSGGNGRLIAASRLPASHFPSAVSEDQPISPPLLVFLLPAPCYFHQLPSKYLSRRVHLNGVHLSYLEPLASRRLLSHNINPNSENITFIT